MPTTRSSPKKRASSRKRAADWTRFSDEQLLDLRFCDLDLSIEGTPLERRVGRLHRELQNAGIRFRPHFWLSDEWFSPDGIPGIAIPFYLAHPRLARLERKQMLEVEGGSEAWCMRILRHETGHALDTAFQLHRRKGYKQNFGNYHDPYPEYYRPRPSSKRYVHHLEPWYAQSHPAEDFAETFAVWLTPRSTWRRDYEGWPAIKKVEYVNDLIGQISKIQPKVKSRAKVDPLHRLKKSLRQHYAERHQHYGVDCPKSFDHDLKKLFNVETSAAAKRDQKTGRLPLAATYLQKHRNELCDTVAQWTNEYRYNINQVLREMIERCRELNLKITRSFEHETQQIKLDAVAMLTVHTMNYLHGKHHRVAL